MFEELFWVCTWLILLYLVHLQFRVCVPVTLACLKVMESCALLLIIKLIVFFQVYEKGIDLYVLKNVTIDLINEAKNYATKLEL